MTARALFIILALLTLIDSIVGAFLFERTGSLALANIVLFAKYVIFGAGFILYISRFASGGGFLRFELVGVVYLIVMSSMILVLTVAYPEHAVANRFYSYVFPIMIYFFGSWMAQTSSLDLKSSLVIYLTLYLILNIIFGIHAYIYGPELIWQSILNYGNYVIEVKGFDDVIGGLPGNFYFDPYGVREPRFVGSLGDPLALGYAAMILACVSWYVLPHARLLLIPVLLVMIYVAFTRAALIGFIIGLGGFWFMRKYAFSLVIATCVVGLLLVHQFGNSVADFLGDSSTEGHVESISQLSEFMSLPAIIGGSLLSGSSTVFEPGFLNILISFGIVPLVLLLIFMRGIFLQHANSSSSLQFVSVLMLAGVVTLTIFSPSFFAITSSWFAWFAAGLVSRPSMDLQRRHTAEVGRVPSGQTLGFPR